MASEVTDHDQNPSPGHDDQGAGNGNGAIASDANRGIKRPRPSKDMDDDDDDEEKGGRERRKIEIKFIQDKSRRHITFSKRKAGIMKKAYELSVLTGTQVLLLVVSETGLVYTFTTPKLQPLVTKPEGKNLIQACLNAPEPQQGGGDDAINGDNSVEPQDDHTPVQPGMHPGMPGQVQPGMPPQAPYGMSPDQAAMNYAYMQQRGQYAQGPGMPGMPPHPGQRAQ